jgi:hypothetical protein
MSSTLRRGFPVRIRWHIPLSSRAVRRLAGRQITTCIVSASQAERPRRLLSANSGGVYGWWGMSFAFAPDGRLAYARPDGIGLVDQDGGYLKPLLGITPFNTHSDWAWIPPITWGADGNSLYFVSHAPAPAPISSEESPYFDLSAISFSSEAAVSFVNSAGCSLIHLFHRCKPSAGSDHSKWHTCNPSLSNKATQAATA